MNIVSANNKNEVLNPGEKKVLDELELFITDNIQVYFQVGIALTQIRDDNLYRQTHETFELYCRDRFDMAARTAYQYITASDIVGRINKCAQIAHIPENEAQVRPLSRLKPDVQVAAWQKAVETAPNGKITALHVAKTVAGIIGDDIRSKASHQQQSARNSSVLSDDLKEVLWTMIEKVREFRMGNTPKSVKDDLKKRLQSLLQLLED